MTIAKHFSEWDMRLHNMLHVHLHAMLCNITSTNQLKCAHNKYNG